jgi:MFS family permease
MARSLLAVILGTFTLRLSTGLTGGALVYYLADLPTYGGPPTDALTVATFSALFYASELIGSPLFGVLSDRLGHRRVMLFGPAFGAIAVVITAFSTNLIVLGGTRVLEGASTAASVPSILGFIAFATAGDEALRGRATARFEAATLAGLMVGFVLAGLFYPVLGPMVFLLNAVLYAISFAIYRFGVPKTAEPPPHPEQGVRGRAALSRYWQILLGSHVWLLAPTWIAINATLGLFTSATLFQLVREPNPEFSDQLLMGGMSPVTVSIGLAIGGLLFFAGIFWWGRRFASMRRTTIIFYGILGGAAVLAAGFGINHATGVSLLIPLALAVLGIAGLFVLAGATPAAIGLLADVTEAYPDDRGAIMGLYSVFLGLGQIVGAILGGFAAQAWGLDGIFVVALLLLAIALLPLAHLRRYEHFVGVGKPVTLAEEA